MIAPGRCRACSRHMEPLTRRDAFGHVVGWTPHGRCISADCTLAYAVQPWRPRRGLGVHAEIKRLGIAVIEPGRAEQRHNRSNA